MAKQIQRTTTRYTVATAFDYLTEGRQYDVTLQGNSRTADYRRTDGSGIGCYVPLWAHKLALRDGALVAVAA